MRDQSVTYYSSISTPLKKKTLYRGTFVAAIGLLPMIWAAIFLPPNLLGRWGIWLFLFWVAMVVWGLHPYKRLTKTESHPHILTVSKKDFTISFHGSTPFSIPKKQIEAVSYLKGKNEYGVLIELKKPLPSGREKLYLPYFSENTFKSLFEQCRAS